MDQTGWTIDESASAIMDSQIGSGQDQTSIYLHSPSYSDRGDVLLMIDVTNKTAATAGIRDCTVTGMTVGVMPHSGVSCPDIGCFISILTHR